MKIDYFIFHVLSVTNLVSEDILYLVLKRLRLFESDILTGSVLRNLNRIFGFDLLSKYLLILLNDFTSGIEIYHNRKMLNIYI